MKTTGKCLMIKTKDHRKFFTHEKNYHHLVEFSKLFKAEVSIVDAKEAEVLDLEELAPAICDATYVQQPPTEYQILEVKINQQKFQRQDILKNAQKIKSYIEKMFLAGEVVSLRDLSCKFPHVTTACLCSHMACIRRFLEQKGHSFVKLGGGKYKKSR